MTFNLSGYVNIGYEEISFLMPFFTTRSQNAVFVQDLDFDYRIDRFLKLEIDEYPDVENAETNTSLSIGDDGILAYRLCRGEVVAGTIEFIRKSLIEAKVTDWAPEMFRLESAIIIQDGAVVSRAIQHASRLFSETSGSMWQRTSMAATNSLTRRKQKYESKPEETELDILVTWLTENIRSEGWDTVWYTAWKRYNGADPLIEIAARWLTGIGVGKSEGIDDSLIDKSGKLLKRLLQDKISSSQILALAESWLFLKGSKPRQWLPIWLSVVRKSYGYELPLLRKGQFNLLSEETEAGISGLTEEAFIRLTDFTPTLTSNHTSVPVTAWSRVWRVFASIEGPERGLLLADQAAEAFYSHISFMKLVVLPCVESGNATPRLVRHAKEWLFTSLDLQIEQYKSTGHSTWGEMFIALLRTASEDAIDYFEIGVRWLKEGYPNVNVWPKVWHAVRVLSAQEHLFFDKDEIAIRWLQRSKMEMYAWADVLMELVHPSFTNIEIVTLASKWLKQAPIDHPYYGAVEEFLIIQGIGPKELQ